MPRLKAAILKTGAVGKTLCYIFGHSSCIFMACLLSDVRKSRLRFSGASQQFSPQIVHIVKCKMSEMLDKYFRRSVITYPKSRSDIRKPYPKAV